MDIKAFYEVIGESFDDALERLRKEERVAKYVRMFVTDPSFAEVESGFSANDCGRAFRGVHSLKGVASNMNFNKLLKASETLTEDLRPGTFTDNSKALFEILRKEYDAVVDAAKKLD